MNLDVSQLDDREKLGCCDKAKFLHRLTYAVAVVDVLIFFYMVLCLGFLQIDRFWLFLFESV